MSTIPRSVTERWDVPGLSSSRLTNLLVRTEDGTLVVTAEHTACPYLAVTPCIGADGALTGQWRLTHVPTGRAFPETDGLDVAELHAVAAALADLAVLASDDDVELRESASVLRPRLHEAIDGALS